MILSAQQRRVKLRDAADGGPVPQDFFAIYLSANGRAVQDLSGIADKLPASAAELRLLASWCLEAERQAVGAGKHFEVKRFSALARQIERLVRERG